MGRLIREGTSSLTSSGGAAASAGPVTGLVVECKYVLRDGNWVRQLHCSCTRPSPIGTFKGIALHREEPDQSATSQLAADGTTPWDGSAALGETAWTTIPGPKVPYAAGDVVVIDNLAPVTENTPVRVYFNSYNTDGVENALVRNSKPSPTPSAVVTCPPPPAAIGPKGREFAEPVTGFSATYSYGRDPSTGKAALIIDTSFTKSPSDTNFVGALVKLLRGDGVEYPLTGPEPGPTTRSYVLQLPVGQERMVVRWYSLGPGGTNSYVHLITPEQELLVDPITVVDPLPNVTGFSVQYVYQREEGPAGKTSLRLRPFFTKPVHPSWAFIEFWCKPPDGTWRNLGYPSETGPDGEAIIWELPSTVADWEFMAVSQDKDNMDRNGKVTTDPLNPPSGSPTFTLTINPPTVDVPLGTGSGFSVTSFYPNPKLYGKKVLLLTPNVTPPTDTAFAHYEFWAKREDAQWYLLGYPSRGGATDVAIIESLPAATFTWEFLLAPYDVFGKNRDGASSTNPASPPSGTLTFSLSIAPPADGPSGLEKTSKVTGLTVAIETRTVSDGGVDWTEYRFYSQWTNPSDTTFGGTKTVVKRTSGTPEFVGDPTYEGAQSTSSRTGWMSVKTGEIYTVYVTSVDVYGSENSIDDTVTPKQTGLNPVSLVANTLKLNRADTSSFNTAEFQINPTTNKWETLQLDAQKIFVGSILRVGGGTGGFAPSFAGSNGQIAVYNASNQLRAWMGQNGSVYGGWFGELYVGGTGPTDAPFYASNAGVVYIGGNRTGTPYITLRDNLDAEVGRIGAKLDGTTTYNGAWLKQLKIAPSLASGSPRVELKSTGVLEIEGGTLKLDLNGTTTTIDNTLDGLQTLYVGLKIARNVGVDAQAPMMTLSHAGLWFTRLVNSLQSAVAQIGTAGTLGSSLEGYLNLNGAYVFSGGAWSATRTIGMSANAGRITITDGSNQCRITPTSIQLGTSFVLGTRQTGWAAATGSSIKTSFDTATVSTAGLAQRVKALIDDLMLHGLIGA